MTSPAAAHLLALEAPNVLIASYPLVMHPFYGVPLALMLHGLVLWRCGKAPPRPAGWRQRDVSRPIKCANDGVVP
jgi:hypothetical protein